MKKVLIIVIVLLFAAGCSNVYPELKENYKVFNVSKYVDISDQDESSYDLINYNDRDYIAYGILKDKIKKDDIKECIGYLQNNEDNRVYTLNESDNDDYIMIYNVKSKETIFYRAMDTRGEDIYMPDLIESSGYYYWKW